MSKFYNNESRQSAVTNFYHFLLVKPSTMDQQGIVIPFYNQLFVMRNFFWGGNWSDKPKGYNKIREILVCPAFLLCSAGPWLCVCGIVFADQVKVEILADMLYLVPILDSNTLFHFAHTFASLCYACKKLTQYYHNLQVCTQYYNEEVHKLCANNGGSPQLFEVCRGIVHGKSLCNCDDLNTQDKQNIIEKVSKTISVLYQNNFVPGNLQPSSILYDKNMEKTYLINFNWTETEHYPFFLNSKFNQVEGIKDGAIMKKKHDLYCLENLIAK
ncbi:11535_t:CDS:2 [Entrophospora sp. SA101]|nr:11535_t:CDS:2 [Entrophospora sp. SA101]